jgi:predicted nuclease with TOPRIM domain
MARRQADKTKCLEERLDDVTRRLEHDKILEERLDDMARRLEDKTKCLEERLDDMTRRLERVSIVEERLDKLMRQVNQETSAADSSRMAHMFSRIIALETKAAESDALTRHTKQMSKELEWVVPQMQLMMCGHLNTMNALWSFQTRHKTDT